MKKKPLIQIGDPVLRKRASRVAKSFTQRTKKLIKTLVEQMRAHDLVGLSAPQLGISSRIYVSEVRATKSRPNASYSGLQICVNPKIVERSAKVQGMHEGCGSVLRGELFAQVPRYTWVRVQYTDELGKSHDVRMTGLLGEIAQHEIDHLDGILFVDRVVRPETYITRELFRRMHTKKKR